MQAVVMLLERAGVLEALAPPTADKIAERGVPLMADTLTSMPTTNPATRAREALDRFRKFQQTSCASDRRATAERPR